MVGGEGAFAREVGAGVVVVFVGVAVRGGGVVGVGVGHGCGDRRWVVRLWRECRGSLGRQKLFVCWLIQGAVCG